jgi:glycosyltransferase involved in cell wall biosynthesis
MPAARAPVVNGPEQRRPLLSIGLPVYNGERFLPQAIQSVLDQSFTDYELLILDNASTDRTPEIAKEHAARDRRIRYHRNARNVGAARNFNLAFELTSGRYFKWAAHDDVLDPSFLERCIAALELDPGAVLACTKATIVDEHGKPLFDYDPALAMSASDGAVRLEALLAEHKCFQIFGVIRRNALERTRLIGLHAHGDGVLLAHLALLGRFVEVPEFLFRAREHPSQSMTLIGDYWNYAEWFNPDLVGRRTFPHWRMFGEYLRVIMSAPLGLRERTASLAALGRVLRERWPLLRGDILFYLRPRLVAAGVPERLLRRASAAPSPSGLSD